MLANHPTLADALAAIEVLPGEQVVVHTLPEIVPGWSKGTITFEIVPTSILTDEMFADDTLRQVITPTTPITGIEAQLNKEQFEGWMADAQAQALTEDGDGFLLGYDPLNPDKRLAASELGMTDECVFDWGRDRGVPPMFEWSEVAAFSANRGSPTAEIYLVDGRSVFIHADVDWYNRLS